MGIRQRRFPIAYVVAYHEAGHALVAESRARADRVAKISIIPRGVAVLGYTQQLPTENHYLMIRAEQLEALAKLLIEKLVDRDTLLGLLAVSAH